MFINDCAFYDYCDEAVEYIEKGNREKMDECIEEAAKLTDWVGVAEECLNYANVFFEMANIWSDKKNYRKAIEYYDMAIKCYEKAAESDPNKAKVAYCNMGNTYELKEDYDKAIKSWEKAIALDRYYVEAYYYIGKAYEAKGDKKRGCGIQTEGRACGAYAICRTFDLLIWQ